MKKIYTCILALVILASITHAQTIRPEFPFTNGLVMSIIKNGNTIYIGGRFTSVSYPSGASYPRNHLAAFDANSGAILPWNPIEGNSVDIVKSLSAVNNIIYAGGDIVTLPQPTSRIFAVDAITGTSTGFPAIMLSRSSLSKILATNTKLYVAAGVEVSNNVFHTIWAFDALNGQTLFSKQTTGNTFSIERKENTLFAGGAFSKIESQTRYYIGAVDATNGAVLPWNPDADWTVWALKIKDNNLFVGGEFTGFGYHPANGIPTNPPVPGSSTTPIKKLAALDATSGAVLPWDPKVEGNAVLAIDVIGRNAYFGGEFTSVGGQTRNNLAMVDAITGIPSSWNPNPNKGISCILADDNTIFVAGSFSSIAGQSRSFFAALTPSADSGPVITCPGNITVSNSPGICSQIVPLNATATGSNPLITYEIGGTLISNSSYNFPVGTTTVKASATNYLGQSSCTFTVTVNDTQAPNINNLSVSTNTLWPVNHKMKDVELSYTTSDNCPGTVNTQLTVTSNEPSSGDDWKIIDNHHIQLKAERLGDGNGRIYTITVAATDQQGNTSTKSATVSVPHDQSKNTTGRTAETLLSLNTELLVTSRSNPSRNYFTLLTQSANTSQKINLRLYDVSGRLLEMKNVAAGETIQMGKTLNAGFYLLQYSQGNIVKQMSLIKQ